MQWGRAQLLWILLVSVLAPAPVSAKATQVAVATNFRAALSVLITEFEKVSPHTIHSAAASTGKLYNQIQQGAPFDILLAADSHHPTLLVAAKLASQQFTYAVGQLSLVGADSSQALVEGNFRRLVIANPRLAPYGVAAKQVITHLGVQEQTSNKTIFAESVGQAMAIYATGNAELALLAHAQIKQLQQADGGATPPNWLIPADMYQPILQDAVLLQRGENNSAAIAFMQFLKSAQAQSIIQQMGYLSLG